MMATLTIKEDGYEESEEVIKVKDFSEATWYLVSDLLATAEKGWGLQIVQEWQELWRDSPAGSPISVTKLNGPGTDSFTFSYNPS